jgi:hypothetical protein
MNLCHRDESGTGDEPLAVMVGVVVGVVVGAQRMRVSKEHWAQSLVSLSRVVGRSIDGIYTRDLYSGDGV